MADNFTRNKSFGPDAVTGYTEAADDVAGVWYPIHKLAFGALDSVTLVNTAAGLPVNIVGGGATVGPGAPTIDSYTHVAINLAAGADQSLVAAPGASKQIWVYGLGFTVNAAGTVSFQDSDDTALSGIMPIAANGGMVNAPSGNFAMPLWKVATNKALECDIITSELDGWICYGIISI